VTIVVLSAVTTLVAGAVTVSHAQEAFPHARHEGLFPACQGCHSGIETGAVDLEFPPRELCATCHNGAALREVAWAEPARTPSNLIFFHQTHLARVTNDGDAVSCTTCHNAPGASGRMTVSRPAPARCQSCHAHEVLEHPDGGMRCTRCHVPLVRAPDLSTDRIAAFPRPSTHGDPSFLTNHAPDLEAAANTCAVCHARPSCERCHLNAEMLPAIQALDPDPRVEALTTGREPEYPTPASHEGDWIRGHGQVASERVVGCANCHARPSCLTCHSEGSSVIDELPLARPEGPQGVTVEATEARALLHPPAFARAHGGEAAGRIETCSSCHTETFCSSCHAGSESPSFHPVNFLESHGSRAYGDDTECVTCHNSELFCRSCHSGVGLASSGRLDAGFHDAQPFWLIGHGQAARQNLSGCVTCHAQTDCATCHSPLGGWGVSPHGPGFEASRFRERASTGCGLCHFGGIPVG
jgi:hypothetical protein